MSNLPRSISVSVALGLAYGIALWLLLFSDSWLSGGLVSIAFLIVVPLTIGFITVSVGAAEGKTRCLYVILAPWLAIVVFLVTSAALLGEGAVCIAIAANAPQRTATAFTDSVEFSDQELRCTA